MATAALIGGSILGAVSSRNASKRVSSSQREGQDQAIAAQKESTAQARGDAIPLFQNAQQNALQGFQGALDVFGQTIPQQFEAFQGGNVGAQNAILAGLGQQQAAILGQQLDPNALQAQTLQLPDFSTFQQQLPEFTDINQALNINQMGPQQFDIGGLIDGFGGGRFGGFGGRSGGFGFNGFGFNGR